MFKGLQAQSEKKPSEHEGNSNGNSNEDEVVLSGTNRTRDGFSMRWGFFCPPISFDYEEGL